MITRQLRSIVAFKMNNNNLNASTQSFGIRNSEQKVQGNKRRSYILCLGGVILACVVGFLIGYFMPRCSDERSSTENIHQNGKRQAFERKFLSILDSEEIKNVSRLFSSKPHLAASQRSLGIALEIERKWREFGFDVVLPEYEVLLSLPKNKTANTAELLDEKSKQVIYKSLPHRDENGVPVFLAYSASDVVQGDLVYVNYGTQEDFEELKKHNISMKGNIAIIRYGKIYRGSKVAIAQHRGAIGVLLYPDPDYFAPYGDYYPQSWWLPPNATQRGSIYPGPSFGDPLTHGLPAKRGMFRNDRDKVNLPQIPAHVLTYGEAVEFLKRMKGREVPSEWRGGLNITYRFGPGFENSNITVRLKTHTENILKNITNVIGTIRGKEEPDRIVVIGAHHDAWIYGAVDAISATAILVELSRVVGVMLKSGWQPRRTIKFCSWAAEEYALIGSTEWVEDNTKLLSDRAVVYLNMDLAVSGNYTLRTFSSPLLHKLIIEATKSVADPSSSDPTRNIYDVMVELDPPRHGAMEPRLLPLATYSDYASFYQYLGIPCIDWGYYFGDKKVILYPVYHSSAETFEWLTKFIDPEFKVHLAVAKLGGIFLMRLADTPLLPMHSVSNYTSILVYSLHLLEKNFLNELQTWNISVKYLKKTIADFAVAAKKFEDYLAKFQDEQAPVKLRILNDQIRQIEKSFLYPNGLPGRNEFKHLIFAPSIHNTYTTAPYPGVTDALFDCKMTSNSTDCKQATFQISLIIHTIEQAIAMLKPIL